MSVLFLLLLFSASLFDGAYTLGNEEIGRKTFFTKAELLAAFGEENEETQLQFEDENQLFQNQVRMRRSDQTQQGKFFFGNLTTAVGIKLLMDACNSLAAVKIFNLCDTWHSNDKGITSTLLHCPPTSTQASQDPRFVKVALGGDSYFHPGAVADYRQKTPTSLGAGQQCVYNVNRGLIVGQPNGGSADLYSPVNSNVELQHIIYDIFPWCYCCRSNTAANCKKYYQKRPSDSGALYTPMWELEIIRAICQYFIEQ